MRAINPREVSKLSVMGRDLYLTFGRIIRKIDRKT